MRREFWVLYDWVLMGINDSVEFWVLHIVSTADSDMNYFYYHILTSSHSVYIPSLRNKFF